MEPWIVYGQTVMVVNGATVDGIDNPAPNTAGLIGEVSSLPYQVPQGKKLVITAYGFEGHVLPNDSYPVYVLVPWLSDQPMPNATPQDRIPRQLASCSASTETNVIYCEKHIPSGKYLNVRLLNNSPHSDMRHGWFMQGFLEDA